MAAVTSTESVLPDPSTPFGERVARRLRNERLIWLITVGRDGTPQPNPVWFLWQGDDNVLVYNRTDANRLVHVRERPNVSLNFDGDGRGGDIIVISGTAAIATDAPAPHELPAYVEKYGDAIVQVSGSLEGFSKQYAVPLRVKIGRVRGF